MEITILAFGPLSETLNGRQHIIQVPEGSSIRYLIEKIGIYEWLKMGLTIALNGNKVSENETLSQGDEVALLPPVSGG